MDVHIGTPNSLDVATLYALLRLRVDVFVVEQQCPYPELDGRDLEPDALHLWVGDAPDLSGCLRVLQDPGGDRRIGRVCVRSAARGTGAAAALMRRAVEMCADSAIVLDAQAPLLGWYARFGFEPAGPEFLEDGIAHVSMRRLSGS